ncbi:hypothetical protein ACFVAV_22455 [Nocardia sp. NPDC057663]|uniref:hypothetical protein n=1 Tax=Nocardia sp. NPDC057663 TaxID=3346201 RepID=UPI00366F34A4
MSALLAMAFTQIAGRTPHTNRIGAWLTRTALEEIIGDLLRARGIEPGRASGHARLSCLEVAYRDSPEVATQAQYAWTRLSEACHHHAYQLSPTHQEVVHLLDIVQKLHERIASRSTPQQ